MANRSTYSADALGELFSAITFNNYTHGVNLHEEESINGAYSIMSMSNFSQIPMQLICDMTRSDAERMALFSKLAYISSGQEDANLRSNGYTMDRLSLESSGYIIKRISDDASNISAELIIRDGEINIAFRGATDIGAWISRLSGDSSTDTFLLGAANNTYLDAFKNIWPLIRKEVDRYAWDRGHDPESYEYYLTGHSVGGAIALLSAVYISKVWRIKKVHVVTFGSPRVFDHKQAQEYNRILGNKTLCFDEKIETIAKDIATTGEYEHVGVHYMLKGGKNHIHTMGDYNTAIQQIPSESIISQSDIFMTYAPEKVVESIKNWALENMTSPTIVLN